MEYRINPKNGDKLSILGYGCLRYTKKGAVIDQAKAEKEMARAIALGVNYFDTAYVYRGSEATLGKFLAKGYREQVYIATKLPHYLIKKPGDTETYFQEELYRLQTNYVDYYLMHMLTNVEAWERLKSLNVDEWLEEKKARGEIRAIGFSYHGGTKAFQALIDAYPWDFCQVQFNYMDEHSQAGIEGIRYAAARGIPVMVMEPLRGGRLAEGLPSKAKELFHKDDSSRSPARRGLEWIWDHPEVILALSGMNDIAQVEDNAKAASERKPLTKKDLALFQAVRKEIDAVEKIHCTGCGYCQPCPQGVDIPNCFRSYNVRFSDGWFKGLKEYFMMTTLREKRSNAGQCVQCGKCKRHCPQAIDIPRELAKVSRKLEGPIYRIAAGVAKKIVRF